MSGDDPFARFVSPAPAQTSGDDPFARFVSSREREPSALESTLRGGAAGLTFNFDDEIVGAFGGDAEAYRRRGEEANAAHPGWYTAGMIGGAFVPVGAPLKGLGLLARGGQAVQAARAARTAAFAARHPIAAGARQVGSYLGTAAGAGVGYGTLSRIGYEQGDLAERAESGLSLANAGSDAALGAVVGGVGGLALGGIARGLETAGIQQAARRAYDDAFAAARARREAATNPNVATNAAFDTSRLSAEARMAAESGAARGEAAELQAMARERFGIDLSRSQAMRDREGKAWLAEAFDGVHGPRGRELAEAIVRRQTEQAPNAFMRVVEGGPEHAPVNASAGAGDFRGALLNRMNEEQAGIDAAEQALAPYGPVQFLTSPSGRTTGLATMRDRVEGIGRDLRLTAADAGANVSPAQAGRAEVASRQVARARENLPIASRFYDDMIDELDLARGDRGRAYTLDDLRQMRQAANRYWQDARAASASPSDRAAVTRLRGALVDWMDDVEARLREGGSTPFRPGNDMVRRAVQRALPEGEQVAGNLGAEALARLSRANEATRTHMQFFGGRGLDQTRVGQGGRGSEARTVTDDISRIVSPSASADDALGELIGKNGVHPRPGAHLTMRAIRERFGDDSPVMRNLKLTILRRFTDRIAEAGNRDNPAVFRTVYAQLDDLLKNRGEFVEATFQPQEITLLHELRDVVRQMQTPGPGASNASRSGIVAARLAQSLHPGVSLASRLAMDGIVAPHQAAREVLPAARPDVVGPSLRSALIGLLGGPRSLWASGGIGAAHVAEGQKSEREGTGLGELW